MRSHVSVRDIIVDGMENKMRVDASARVEASLGIGLTLTLKGEIGGSEALQRLIDRYESVALKVKFQIKNYGYSIKDN